MNWIDIRISYNVILISYNENEISYNEIGISYNDIRISYNDMKIAPGRQKIIIWKLLGWLAFIVYLCPLYEEISLHNSIDSFPSGHLYGSRSFHCALLLCPMRDGEELL